MSLTLVILAAGMGSRFGGLKQITPVSKSGESIMDFSVYDAIRSGYERVIIVIRSEIQNEFRSFFGKRLESQVDLHYAYQDIDLSIAPDRKKPFGTAHAVLAAAKFINGPFSVINADDFYGLESFQKSASFFTSSQDHESHAVIAYGIRHTLSDHGSVSRAECQLDPDNYLIRIRELLSVYQKRDSFYYSEANEDKTLDPATLVSMNFWNFKPGIFHFFQNYWDKFLDTQTVHSNAEYLIPEVVNEMIQNAEGTFKVIPTKSPWFGITYKEDFGKVSSGIQDLTNSGLYSSPLWN